MSNIQPRYTNKNKYKNILILITLLVFGTLVYYKVHHSSKSTVSITGQANATTSDLKSTWVPYTNKDYNYVISYPISLTINEIKDAGGYMEFIRFEENGLTGDKGIGVGVRKNNLKSEVTQIKKEIDDTDDGNLVGEKNIKVGDYNAIELNYEPKDPTLAEKRSIVILVKGDYAYSISTVPEQIDKVLEGFKLTN